MKRVMRSSRRSKSPLTRRYDSYHSPSPPPSRSHKKDTPVYSGPEHGPIGMKEQKKIQIDIRRNIPSSKVSHSPIERHINNVNNLHLPRRQGEGGRPLFERDEIRNWSEKKVQVSIITNKIDEYERRLRNSSSNRRSRSRSPIHRRTTDVRDRLGKDRPIHSRLGHGRDQSSSAAMDRHRDKNNIASRLGSKQQTSSSDRVLAREELESQRPEVKPWDINPEFVPRGLNYFEHDNREDYEPRHGGRGGQNFRRNNRGSGFNNGRRRPFNNRRTDGIFSSEWKHDKYTEDE